MYTTDRVHVYVYNWQSNVQNQRSVWLQLTEYCADNWQSICVQLIVRVNVNKWQSTAYNWQSSVYNRQSKCLQLTV